MAPARHDYSAEVTYSQAHLRLKKDRGCPTLYACVGCDAQAREWAYRGGCPQELTDDLGRAYSLDQARYVPMCVSCHRRHDRASADGRSLGVCPQGHPWSVENTGVRKRRGPSTGIRYCRACHRENSARYRERRKQTLAA